METVKKFLDALEHTADISEIAERYHLILARKWNGITSIENQQIERFFYRILGGSESSPLDVFHTDIRKKLAAADPASVTLYECVGRQDAILQCLKDMPELQSASLLLVLTRCSEAAEWELMMSDGVGRAAKELIPAEALFLSTLGEPMVSLKPEELAVYLLIVPAGQ